MFCSKAFKSGAGGNFISVPVGVPPLDYKLCPTIKEAQEFIDSCKTRFDGFSCWPSVRNTRKPRGYDAAVQSLRFDRVD